MKDVRVYLEDLLETIQAIEDFTAEGREYFLRDKKTQFAVRAAFETIGEIVKRLPADLLSTHPQIAWNDIARFRDILIHHYDRIDLNIVWQSIAKLADLKSAVQGMLAHLNSETGPE